MLAEKAMVSNHLKDEERDGREVACEVDIPVTGSKLGIPGTGSGSFVTSIKLRH
jgi:hypothetical protein